MRRSGTANIMIEQLGNPGPMDSGMVMMHGVIALIVNEEYSSQLLMVLNDPFEHYRKPVRA